LEEKLFGAAGGTERLILLFSSIIKLGWTKLDAPSTHPPPLRILFKLIK
jgi:hypothetical protein